MIDMLKTKKCIIWENEPRFFKSGTIFKRVQYEKESEYNNEKVIRTKIDVIDKVLRELPLVERVELVMSKYFDSSL